MKKKVDYKIPNEMIVEARNSATHPRISSVEKIQKIKDDTFKMQIYL